MERVCPEDVVKVIDQLVRLRGWERRWKIMVLYSRDTRRRRRRTAKERYDRICSCSSVGRVVIV
jgi:hypothetical protein